MSAAERTILVVEDNEDDRLAVRRLLARQRPGYTLLEAGTGGEALEQIRMAKPDCVLLDFFLPDMSGADVISALKRGEGEPGPLSVPVVMLSGQERDDVASAVLALGAQDYLIKDAITPLGLARAIDNAIEKYAIQRALEEQRLKAESRSRKLEALRAELQDNLNELSDAQRARERFLAVMSHEMRTPLNAIIGYADLLDMEIDGPLTDGQRAHLARVRVGSRHLLDLINDVLDLARADAHRLELDMRTVDVRAVLEEVAALLQSQAEAKGLALRVEAAPDEPPHVQADLQRLRQVLTNLVGNAIKFTEDGGVTISCEVDADQVRVHVTDTGIGIEPEALPLVFEDFYQAKGELTRERGGSGLGLAIARRLAELMGGSITATSTLGDGSTFTLSLRRAADSELRAEDVARHEARMDAMTPSPRRSASAATVVAFGGVAAALEALRTQVHPGVRLVWTTDPAEVSSLAVRENAALVVLDMGAAPHAAWRAAHTLQDVPELADTAVLLLPAIPPATAGEPGEGLDLGWVSVVPKPFTPEQLTRAVAAAASRDDDETFTVLVVDDDPDSRRVAARFLTEAGAAIREVADGESALIDMRRSPPDVVVLDLMMPVLDGFGVLAAMRTDPSLVGMPVVVLTAKSLTEAEREFLARSAVSVLQKGEYRLADVAALVLRAARSAQADAGS